MDARVAPRSDLREPASFPTPTSLWSAHARPAPALAFPRPPGLVPDAPRRGPPLPPPSSPRPLLLPLAFTPRAFAPLAPSHLLVNTCYSSHLLVLTPARPHLLVWCAGGPFRVWLAAPILLSVHAVVLVRR